MELARNEPRMIRQLNHFDQPVDRVAGTNKARLGQLIGITIVELIAMPVSFVYDILLI